MLIGWCNPTRELVCWNIDCEGFRVALFYARKVLAAAERGKFDEIEPAWLEAMKQISVESA